MVRYLFYVFITFEIKHNEVEKVDYMQLISVIVPVYNVEKFLRCCMESIINQTYRNIEIILVDDGSTDNSGDICEEYRKKDNRVKVIHKKNGGLSDARNYGINMSNGDYIVLIDSDDFVSSEYVEKLYELVKGKRNVIGICDFYYVDENGKVMKDRENARVEKKILEHSEFWDMYYSEQIVRSVVAWNKIYPRQILEYIQYPVGKWNEDEFVLYDLIQKSSKILCTNDKLYYYRQRESSIMNQKYGVKRLDSIEAYIKRAKRFYEENEMIYAELSITLAVEGLVVGYKKLNFNEKDSLQRYRELKCNIKMVYKAMKRNMSLHYKLNTKLFLISEKLYINLHNLIGKKKYA